MNEKQDFTTGSIPKKMIGFMLPVLGALILQAMYGAVDLMIVGRFGTTEGISGVTTGSSIMNLVTFTVSSLTTGVTVIMGQYLGEKRPERLGGLVGGATCFFFIISLVLTAVLLIFARPIAILMQAPESALDLTVTYIRICGAGYVFIVFYNFISSIFRGLGDSRMPLLFVAIACVVNIIGDLVLVAGFHMNVAGAAIATVLAQAVSVVLSIVIIFRKNLGFTLQKADFRLSGEVTHFLVVDALAGLFTEDAAVVKRAFEFLRGFAPEAIVTSILFSYMGYFNGHAKSLFVMIQGLAQSFLVRLPMSYLMSIRPNASLFGVGLAAPSATVFGIILCTIYYVYMKKQI